MLEALLQLAFGATIILIVVAGLGILVPRPVAFSANPDALQAAEMRQVLRLSNPIHTDIALPADPDVLRAFSIVSDGGLKLDYPGVHWVIFGWGGRSFYIETPTWGDLRPGPVLDALTWDRSVMHVRRSGAIATGHTSVQTFDISSAQFETLVRQIRASFETSDGQAEAIAGAAYDAHDIFFPANGGFNAFLGCNTWTASMLRAAGLKTGFWTPLPNTLRWSLDLHNE
ncbi:TIGR02117 family protein [Roseibium sp. RKSG952]|uniref:TIGR02117 family protein n=1 Tax=Roseibium sp. RKSG952 TaxID=2529384 RepID=UPI0034CF6A58